MNNLKLNIKKANIAVLAITIFLSLFFYFGVNYKTRIKNYEQLYTYVYSDYCIDQPGFVEDLDDLIITEEITVDFGLSDDKVNLAAYENANIAVFGESYLDRMLSGGSLFKEIDYLVTDQDTYDYNGRIVGIKVFDVSDSSKNDYLVNDYFNFTENMYLVVLEKKDYDGLDNHIKAFLGEKNEYEEN